MTIVSDGDKFSVYKMKQGQVGSITDMGAMRRYWYAETRFKPKFTGSLSEALEYIEKQGAEYMETEVFKTNPRPRKYASASERQAAYRARAPEVCFRAEDKTVDTLDRIAADLDVSRADLLLSMTKFALTNHDWARFGLTHKPLPFGYGTHDETRKENPVKMTKRQEVIEFGKRMGFKASAGKGYVYLTNMVGFGETFDDWDKAHAYVLKAYDDHYVHRTPYPWDYKDNPTMKTTTKRKPTPAQLAARERFAEMARSGAFKKAGASRRKKNPLGETGGRYEIRWPSGDVKASYDSLGDAKDFLDDIDRPVGAFVGVDTKTGKVFYSFAYETKMMREGRKTNPAKPTATRRGNPIGEKFANLPEPVWISKDKGILLSPHYIGPGEYELRPVVIDRYEPSAASAKNLAEFAADEFRRRGYPTVVYVLYGVTSSSKGKGRKRTGFTVTTSPGGYSIAYALR
jgi:hypothetical protein